MQQEYRMNILPITSCSHKFYANADVVPDEALVLESQVLSLQSPDTYVLEAFRKWFSKEDNPDVRRRIPKLGGISSERLDDKNDLCALHNPADPDRLSRFFLHHLGFLFPVLDSLPGRNLPSVYFTDILCKAAPMMADWHMLRSRRLPLPSAC